MENKTLSKKEAAEYLGIGVRSLERYSTQGKISVIHKKGRTRPTAHFEISELDRLKAELEQEVISPAVDHVVANHFANAGEMVNLRQIAPEVEPMADELAYYPPGEIMETGENATIEKLTSIIESLLMKKQSLSVPIADKLVLSISEVQALTNLSRKEIMASIISQELVAVKKRSWLIPRKELDSYIDRLFGFRQTAN